MVFLAPSNWIHLAWQNSNLKSLILKNKINKYLKNKYILKLTERWRTKVNCPLKSRSYNFFVFWLNVEKANKIKQLKLFPAVFYKPFTEDFSWEVFLSQKYAKQFCREFEYSFICFGLFGKITKKNLDWMLKIYISSCHEINYGNDSGQRPIHIWALSAGRPIIGYNSGPTWKLQLQRMAWIKKLSFDPNKKTQPRIQGNNRNEVIVDFDWGRLWTVGWVDFDRFTATSRHQKIYSKWVLKPWKVLTRRLSITKRDA